MPGGRPPKWTSPDQIENLGMAYINECIEGKIPLTVSGLALALDTTRETLMDYQEKDEFSDTVKKLKTHCEKYAEMQAYVGKNPAAAIFVLKNHGWRDKQEIDHKNDGGKFEQTEMTPAMLAAQLKAAKVYEEEVKKSLLE